MDDTIQTIDSDYSLGVAAATIVATLLPNVVIDTYEMASTDPDTENVDMTGIRSYLEQTEVVFALLFGSHARGTARSDSDVDIALHFPPEFDAHDRFRARNRIDADLQQFATGFVDVSDIDQLPTEVAYEALRHGTPIVGDEEAIITYRDRIADEYESTALEREEERQEFIDRLARGDV